eukprot:TRINITY_DN56483_c0_g1_i1.p2 TRINITY_DN56483_c0_g1~~TRINITY_DN56483_c0_g1_i1.p2  ORF type:complete len:215 (+),score=96.36 TRINITY_DN56483_c0_g1_i1:85-645(+)
MDQKLARLDRQKQVLLDRSVPHVAARYGVLLLLLGLYAWRIVSVQGFYVVTYALAIYLLKLAVLFVSPLKDPDEDSDDSDAALPTTNAAEGEYKPFIRKMPEFKVWYGAAKAVLIAFCCTLFGFFDIPVFWPILLMYFIILFVLTAKKQLLHMWKHKYLPFSIGKKKYANQPTGPAAQREFDKRCG